MRLPAPELNPAGITKKGPTHSRLNVMRGAFVDPIGFSLAVRAGDLWLIWLFFQLVGSYLKVIYKNGPPIVKGKYYMEGNKTTKTRKSHNMLGFQRPLLTLTQQTFEEKTKSWSSDKSLPACA